MSARVAAAYAVGLSAYVYARGGTTADIRGLADRLGGRDVPDDFDEIVTVIDDAWQQYLTETKNPFVDRTTP